MSQYVLYGGSLLHHIKCSKNISFGPLVKQYSLFVQGQFEWGGWRVHEPEIDVENVEQSGDAGADLCLAVSEAEFEVHSAEVVERCQPSSSENLAADVSGPHESEIDMVQNVEQSGDAGADLHLSVSEAEFEVHPAESDADVSVVNDVMSRSRARKRKQNIQPSIPKNRRLKGPPDLAVRR